MKRIQLKHLNSLEFSNPLSKHTLKKEKLPTRIHVRIFHHECNYVKIIHINTKYKLYYFLYMMQIIGV